MDITKLLRGIAQGCSADETLHDELVRLRAENALLRMAVAAASEALSAAPLWHSQHRAANNILLDTKDELADMDDAAACGTDACRH